MHNALRIVKISKNIILCEKDPQRLQFVQNHWPDILTVSPEHVLEFTRKHSNHGGADRV